MSLTPPVWPPAAGRRVDGSQVLAGECWQHGPPLQHSSSTNAQRRSCSATPAHVQRRVRAPAAPLMSPSPPVWPPLISAKPPVSAPMMSCTGLVHTSSWGRRHDVSAGALLQYTPTWAGLGTLVIGVHLFTGRQLRGMRKVSGVLHLSPSAALLQAPPTLSPPVSPPERALSEKPSPAAPAATLPSLGPPAPPTGSRGARGRVGAGVLLCRMRTRKAARAQPAAGRWAGAASFSIACRACGPAHRQPPRRLLLHSPSLRGRGGGGR